MSDATASSRLFFALEPPPRLRHGLASWAGEVARRDPALRAIDSEDLHLTLLFLGTVPEASLAALGSVLLALPARRVGLEVVGVSALPVRRPRLFAAELRAREAPALRGELLGLLTDAGLPTGPPEDPERPFWPHVTLARVRRGRAANVVAEAFSSPPRELGGEHDAVRVCLYRSNKSSGGSPGGAYEPMAGLELPHADGGLGRSNRNREVIERDD